MSQAGLARVTAGVLPPVVPIQFTANDATIAVPALGNLNVFGAVVAAGIIPFATTAAGSTLTVNLQKSQAIAASDSTKLGLSNFDSAAFQVDANGFVQLKGGGIASTSFSIQANTAPGTNPVLPSATGVITINGAAVANHSVVLETRSRAANAYNLEVQYGTSAAATDATKSGVAHFNSAQFTVDANGFVSITGGGAAVEHLTGNTGGQLNPDGSNNFNILGTGSITVAGSVSTLTAQLTGLTNHAIQIGAGTATLTQLAIGSTGQVLQANSSADPTWSTATYPSTTTINQILYSSAANTVSGLATANQGVLTTGTTGIPVITAIATNGQIIIGSTAGAPAAATLSAGNGISITNASNSITIASVQGGFVWSDTSGTVTAVAQNGYFITTTCTSTLPASPSEGDTVKYIVDTTNLLTITGNTGQKIRIGTQLSAAAGTAVNTQQGDSIELVYRTTGTTWFASSNPVGGWNVT